MKDQQSSSKTTDDCDDKSNKVTKKGSVKSAPIKKSKCPPKSKTKAKCSKSMVDRYGKVVDPDDPNLCCKDLKGKLSELVRERNDSPSNDEVTEIQREVEIANRNLAQEFSSTLANVEKLSDDDDSKSSASILKKSFSSTCKELPSDTEKKKCESSSEKKLTCASKKPRLEVLDLETCNKSKRKPKSCKSGEHSASTSPCTSEVVTSHSTLTTVTDEPRTIVKEIKEEYKAPQTTEGIYKMLMSEKFYFGVLILFISIIFGLVKLSINTLPEPNNETDLEVLKNTNSFQELQARIHLKNFLSFGLRPAGSVANDEQSMKYIKNTVRKLVKDYGQSPVQVEIDVTTDKGSFGLNFLSGFASSYQGVKNTVVKLSSPDHQISENALLVNCHTDSALGALGASDDAVACSILIEIIRAILANQEPLKAPLIFLFNGAEENILQGSHAFITQHKWAKQVKAFINLEAAGAGGKELVFQTGPGSPWLAKTWAKNAPHPFGSVFAQELFQTGIIPSDTDFRIFRDFGKIPGIDLAYMKNGYVYHTIYDNEEMIPSGSIQRAGDNILSMVKATILDCDSDIHDPSAYQHGSVAFFDILGIKMITVPMRLLYLLNYLSCLIVALYIGKRLTSRTNIPVLGYDRNVYISHLSFAVFIYLGSIAFMILMPVLLASLLTAIGQSMTFYSDWRLAVIIYLPISLLSLIQFHRSCRLWYFAVDTPEQVEQIFADASILIWTFLLFCLTIKGLQTSIFFLMIVLPSITMKFIQLSSETVVNGKRFHFLIRRFTGQDEVAASTKFLHQYQYHIRFICQCASYFAPVLIFMQHSEMLLAFFVPLCGRMGTERAPDLLVAGLVSVSLLPLCKVINNSIHLVINIKIFRKLMYFSVLSTFILLSIGVVFPYKSNPSKPAPMRLYSQHIQRNFYGMKGEIESKDAGIWINCLDYRCLNIKSGFDEMDAAKSILCDKGVFCQWPWYVPFDKEIKRSRYIKTNCPLNCQINNHPLDVAFPKREVELLSKNRTHQTFSYRVTMTVNGPSHLSLQIGPLQSISSKSKLASWSLNVNPHEVSRPATIKKSEANGFYFDKWFFVYHSSGIQSKPWDFWFELIVVNEIRYYPTLPCVGDNLGGYYPSVEVGVSAHYLPKDLNKCSTLELQNMNNQLEDWIANTCFQSVYNNYLF